MKNYKEMARDFKKFRKVALKILKDKSITGHGAELLLDELRGPKRECSFFLYWPSLCLTGLLAYIGFRTHEWRQLLPLMAPSLAAQAYALYLLAKGLFVHAE